MTVDDRYIHGLRHGLGRLGANNVILTPILDFGLV